MSNQDSIVVSSQRPELKIPDAHYGNEDFLQHDGLLPQEFAMSNLYSVKCVVGETRSRICVASLIRDALKFGAVNLRNETRRGGVPIDDTLLNTLTLGDTSPLQYVALDGKFRSVDATTILDALAHIVTLRGVRLASCAPRIEQLDRFLAAIERCTAFDEIQFEKLKMVTNRTLGEVDRISTLKCVLLSDCHKLYNNGFYTLVDNSKSLKEISIDRKTNHPSDLVAYAREKNV
ncbi:hypothetical protein BDB00DRAFT_875416 [Zychaea mexicana]|uniref:uncharacterized protein n=1 Tax=Zychaea mexicana TaxID=64656 RepID=UPI0022FE776F|nr:uncharacterized protein BDB00DRAFT_875416 [Zychaea mexicana]KAI9490366.1 hypothetical protein BDB00DRAFT_875416 [Zychaea mexicana]